jgi:hypothetical protein
VITAYLKPLIMNKEWHAAGLCWRESGTGEIVALAWGRDGTGPAVRVEKFGSATSYTADYTAVQVVDYWPWMRIADDGSSRISSISNDGLFWRQIHSVSRTDFLTADQVGFMVSDENSGVPNLDVGCSILSWLETEG